MDRDPETLEMRPEIGDEPVRQPLHPTNDSDSRRSSNSSSRTKFILIVGGVGLTGTTLLSIYLIIANSNHQHEAQSSAQPPPAEIPPSISYHRSVYVRWGAANCPETSQPLDAEGYAAVTFNSDGTITGGEVLCMLNKPASGENLTVESGSVKLKVAPVNLMNLSEDNSQQNQTGLLQCAICSIKHPYTVTLFGREDCDETHSDLADLYSGYVVGFPGASSICVKNDTSTREFVREYPAGKLTPAEQENEQKSVPCTVCYGKWLPIPDS